MPKRAIRALPGRAILEFPQAKQAYKGLIHVPETSQRRIEFARLISCGDATNPEEEIRRRAIVEADKNGFLFAVTVASGVALHQLELENDTSSDNYGKEKKIDLGDLNYLKSYRVYSISQLHTAIDDPETKASFPAEDVA